VCPSLGIDTLLDVAGKRGSVQITTMQGFTQLSSVRRDRRALLQHLFIALA